MVIFKLSSQREYDIKNVYFDNKAEKLINRRYTNWNVVGIILLVLTALSVATFY